MFIAYKKKNGRMSLSCDEGRLFSLKIFNFLIFLRRTLPNTVFTYPQQATYMPGGVLLPANAAPAQPQQIIEYGGGLYAAAQVPGAYAADVAAAAGTGKYSGAKGF